MKPQKPIVPEEHLEPTNPDELHRLKEKAQCRESPTGSHHFILISGEDGKTDGPCRYCHKLHSIVHKPKQKNKRGGTHKMAKETKTQEQITVKDLAEKSGVEAKRVRKVLRKQFGGGAGKNYTWKKGDPKVDEILKALKDLKNGKKGERGGKKVEATKETKTLKTTEKVSPTPAKKETKKPTTKKSVEKPVEKAEDAKPVEKPGKLVDQSLKRKLVARKVANETIAKTGKAPTTEDIDNAMAAEPDEN